MASGGSSPARPLTPSFLGLHNMPLNSSPLKNSTNMSSTTITSNGTGTSSGIVICVFCGSSPGKSPSHMAAARALASVFASQNIKLVYGGGTVGLMGEVARSLVALSGPDAVHGIIPAPLMKYERGPDSTDDEVREGEDLPKPEIYGRTTVVKDMHTRKQMMAQEVLTGSPGSGFIALSGGYGTLEELMEVVTWNQLGIHSRGVVVYNVEGYWDGLLEWVRNSVRAGFVGEGTKGIIKEARTAEDAVRELRGYKAEEGRFKLEWGNQ